MPNPESRLAVDDVRRAVERQCLIPEVPARVGVELEWHTFSASGRGRVDVLTLRPDLAGTIGSGSTLTFEPGGQLEISSPPAGTIDEAVAVAAADLTAIDDSLVPYGIRLLGEGVDPLRPPRRVVRSLRYDAMERHFNGRNPAGKHMMCNTAAIQVNVGVGDAPECERQWQRAHALGPVLVAAFANSPIANGRPTGLKSTRLATWSAIDPSRTRPVASSRLSAAESWAEYALDARVMLIRSADGKCFEALDAPFTLRQWVEHGHRLGYPDLGDVDYHLGTLFPPVRPRGWLELRIFDALPSPWWRVPVALSTALLWDGEHGQAAVEACAKTVGRWQDAYRHGLDHPAIAEAAVSVFESGMAALDRIGVSGRLRSLVSEYADRYVNRRRCPADERVDEWVRGNGDWDRQPHRSELEAAWT